MAYPDYLPADSVLEKVATLILHHSMVERCRNSVEPVSATYLIRSDFRLAINETITRGATWHARLASILLA
jgi:hypothetical protein